MMRMFLIFLLFLTSCASSPIKNCNKNDIQFVVLKGFEIEHQSCMGLTAIAWKTIIRLCEDDKWKDTNLWCYWNGCKYKLYQQNKEGISLIGYFKTLNQMEEFLKITMPMTRVK